MFCETKQDLREKQIAELCQGPVSLLTVESVRLRSSLNLTFSKEQKNDEKGNLLSIIERHRKLFSDEQINKRELVKEPQKRQKNKSTEASTMLKITRQTFLISKVSVDESEIYGKQTIFKFSFFCFSLWILYDFYSGCALSSTWQHICLWYLALVHSSKNSLKRWSV